MHELSIASSIVDALLDLTKKHGAGHVSEVHLRLGRLRALSIDQLKFSFDVLAKGTMLEGSKLLITEAPANVHCPSCMYEADFNSESDQYHFSVPSLICPKCDGFLEILGGDECLITRVRMQLRSEVAPTG